MKVAAESAPLAVSTLSMKILAAASARVAARVTPAEAATPGWAFDCVDRLAAELQATVIVAGHVHEAFRRQALQPNVWMPGPLGTVIELPIHPILDL